MKLGYGTMVVGRKFNIKDKVLGVTDIRRIAEMFYRAYSELPPELTEEQRYSVGQRYPKFSLEGTDGVQYSADSLDILKPDGVLDSKAVRMVEMSFRDYRRDIHMEVRITASSHADFDNRVEVQGPDESWVNTAFIRLKETIDDCQNQDSPVKKHCCLVSLVIGLVISWTLGAIVVAIISAASSELEPEVFSPWPLIGLVLSLPIALFIDVQIIDELWPDVELIPGPVHVRKLQRRRRIMYGALTAVVVPFIVAVVAGVLTR